MCAVDLSVVPFWGQPFIVISMKMSEKVFEGIFGKRFAEIEVIDHDIRMRDKSRHGPKD